MDRFSLNRLSRPVQLLVLSATALALLGHAVDGPPSCLWKDGESYDYNVVGTCGEPGVITVKRSSSSCSVEVTGDEVGLPREGNLVSKLSGGFDLYGMLNEDWNLNCSVAQSVDGQQQLSCYRTEAWPPHSQTAWCEATLYPATGDCHLDDCTVPNCDAAEHLARPAGACCPVCEADLPTTAKPTALPDLCENNGCLSSCPDGQELVQSSQTCCPSCVTQPQSCLDGRDTFRKEAAQGVLDALDCQQDLDCSIFATGSRCGGACPAVMSVSGFLALQDELQPLAEQWCSTCQGDQNPEPCPPIGGPSKCVLGKCVLDCSLGGCL